MDRWFSSRSQRRLVCAAAVCWLVLAAAGWAWAKSGSPPLAPMRYIQDRTGEHLDTAVCRFRRGKVSVDLVGAIHVGDRAYYAGLQRRLAQYPSVLYELVKPEGASVSELDHQQGGLSGLQRLVRDWLALEFQLDRIDYRGRNFVHADIDSERLVAQVRAHAGDLLGSLLSWSLAEAARQTHADGTPRAGNLGLLLAMASSDRSTALKRYLGRELASANLDGQAFGGLALGGLLIGERNARVISVLEQQLATKHRRIAIFYGAAHLPDLAKRLKALGFVEAGPPQWLVAWSVAPPQRIQTAPAAK